MSILFICIMTVILVASTGAVLWTKKDDQPYGDAPDPSKAVPKASAATSVADARASDLPAYAPPDGSLLTAQLEVDQTFYIQTQTAKYALTLRDPTIGLYDAERTGLKKDGKVVEERFQMLFKGTFVPYRGLRFREFVPGGHLHYQKIHGDGILEVNPSSTILRILFSIRESYQQAS